MKRPEALRLRRAGAALALAASAHACAPATEGVPMTPSKPRPPRPAPLAADTPCDRDVVQVPRVQVRPDGIEIAVYRRDWTSLSKIDVERYVEVNPDVVTVEDSPADERLYVLPKRPGRATIVLYRKSGEQRLVVIHVID